MKAHRTETQATQEPADLMRPEAAARFLGVSPYTLKAWRIAGTGPHFVRLTARAVRYRLDDLKSWIARREARAARGVA